MVVMISMDQGKTIDQFFTAHNIDQMDKFVAELHDEREAEADLQRDRPGFGAELQRRPHLEERGGRQRGVRQGHHVEHRRQGAGAGLDRAPVLVEQGGPAEGRSDDADPGRGGQGSQEPVEPGVGQVPALQQPVDAHDPPGPAHVHPRHHPRRDHRAPRRQPGPRRPERVGPVRAGHRGQVPLRRCDHAHDRGSVVAAEHQRLPQGRHVRAGRHRRRGDGAHPARPVRRPVAPAARWR